ncbi:T9SS type B sorting domain-containing protein [Flavobacterium sp.]|uniref:T9SS type B sorting domain-containing protein n=1 Tax=Flavobacterium sp. TaxID=239 RepID=UPI00286DE5AE|nr:T9SS type B sorting domain-containing protein [Flavobacterium sp.]
MNNKDISFKIKLFVLTILFFAKGWGQVTIAPDGLNNSSLSFSTSGGQYYTGKSTSGDLPSNSPFFLEGTHSYGVINGTATLTSNSDINTSGYSFVTMSLRVAAFSIGSSGNGVELDDIVTVEVSPDGGSNWFSTLRVLGESNACWSFSGGKNATTAYDGNSSPVNFKPNSGGELTSDGYSTITINNLPSVLNLRFKITLVNDSSRELWVVDDFKVTGTVSCTPPVLSTVYPNSGPVGTEVVITASSGDLSGATANFGGVAATVISTSTTQMTILVPTAATGNLTIKNSVGCQVPGAFTILKEDKTSCSGGTGSFSDLIISEVYDSKDFNVWHMELYNPTASPIDLSVSNYEFEIYQTKGDPSSLSRTVLLSGIILPGKVFLANLGDSGTPCPKAFDFTDSSQGINEDDQIRLTKNGVLVDVVNCPTTKGYTIERKPTAIGPKTTFSDSDWTTSDNESCSNLGTFPYTSSSAPTIVTQPTFSPSCSNIVFFVTANEGVVGGNSLAYQWYFAVPNSPTWMPVTDGGVYNGATNSVLAISSYSGLLGYQYYCQVRENTATCSSDSNAVKISSSGSSVVLNITNPAKVCGAIGIVDITVPAVTAGSIGSGSLSYWTDIAATIPLPNPSTVASSGTYYIKSVAGTCSDIKPVVVTINSALVLSISNPNPVCAPATVDITATAVTAGSTGSGILSYWTDPAATSALANPSTIATTGTYYIKSVAGTCSDIKPVTTIVNPQGGVLTLFCDAANTTATSVRFDFNNITGYKGYNYSYSIAGAAPVIGYHVSPSNFDVPVSGPGISVTFTILSVDGVPCVAPVSATCSSTCTSLVTPTFTGINAICAGESLSALPTTSNNSITGTWSPALDNTATKTYTFTPTAGQCATTTTLTIPVNSKVIPTFTILDPICTGESLSALPTTSNNSIVGSWSPALDSTTTTTYTFTPAAGQCATTTTLIIPVNSKVIPTFAAVAPICSGVTISALPTTSNNSITGTWSPALDNMTTKTYTFTPAANQCATTATMTVTVSPNVVTPTFSPVATICSGEILLPLPTTSNNSITGTWSPAIDNTVTKTYTFTPTAGQCAATTTQTVTVNSKVIPTFTAVAPICSGGTLSALPTTSNNSITGTWSPSLDDTATTTYIFTPTAGQCASNASLTVVVNNNITTDLIYYLCIDKAGLIVAPIPIETNLSLIDYSFAWEYNGSPISATSSSYDATAVGVYKVTATSSTGGCTIVFNADVKESKEAIAVATVGNDFDNQQQIIVTVTGGLGNYEYQLDDGLPQSSPIFSVFKGGEYTVKVIDKLGCNNFDLNVTALNYPRFFTPNTDGFNDTWNIEGLNQPEKAIIYIFDQYGKLLKQIAPTGRGWDGIYNGVALPASDYWFHLLYQDSIGANKEFKAHFSLKR